MYEIFYFDQKKPERCSGKSDQVNPGPRDVSRRQKGFPAAGVITGRDDLRPLPPFETIIPSPSQPQAPGR